MASATWLGALAKPGTICFPRRWVPDITCDFARTGPRNTSRRRCGPVEIPLLRFCCGTEVLLRRRATTRSSIWHGLAWSCDDTPLPDCRTAVTPGIAIAPFMAAGPRSPASTRGNLKQRFGNSDLQFFRIDGVCNRGARKWPN